MKKSGIKWDLKAKESLKAIYSYYKKLSVQAAKNIKGDILEETKKLLLFPDKFQTEPMMGEPYRYRVVRHYKIIYRAEENGLRIVEVFDTRQDHEKLKKL